VQQGEKMPEEINRGMGKCGLLSNLSWGVAWALSVYKTAGLARGGKEEWGQRGKSRTPKRPGIELEERRMPRFLKSESERAEEKENEKTKKSCLVRKGRGRKEASSPLYIGTKEKGAEPKLSIASENV